MSQLKVENQKIQKYSTALREQYRPPSRGGNTGARHSHYLTINGETYSFLAFGSQQWVFKSDTVSFEYEIKGEYKNILSGTIRTVSASGQPVVRGNRGSKKLRTAPPRMPASRREQRD